MHKSKGFLIGLLLLVIGSGGYWWYNQQKAEQSAATTNGSEEKIVANTASSSDSKKHDELVLGISQAPKTFNRMLADDVSVKYVMGMTTRPLTGYGKDWKSVCILCTEYPSLEKGTVVYETTKDGKEGMAVTFKIHPDAKWGDGKPVTTDDFLFTYEVGKNKVVPIRNSELFRDRILGIDKKDDKTFVVHFDKRYCDLAESIGDFLPLPKHIEEANFKDPAKYEQATAYNTDPTNPGLYYGPYKFAEFVPGSHLVLEKNPTWYGKAPQFNKIVVKFIENLSALEANLLSGDIDYIPGEIGVKLDQALPFEKRHGDKFKVMYEDGLLYEHIEVNLDNPILADKRVRQALMYGMNREAIVGQLFDNKQKVAHSKVSPQDSVYNDKVRKYEYDPQKAIALLEEAGWKEIKDGVRYKDGKPLELDIMSTAGDKTREQVQQILQNDWGKIGVKLTINNQPARVFFGETTNKRKFPALVMFAWSSAPKHIPATIWKSKNVPTEENGWTGQNFTNFKNAEMDKLIDDVEVTCEDEASQKLWDRIQELSAEELPYLSLYYRTNPYMMQPWLAGIDPYGHFDPTTFRVEDWHVKKE